MKMTRDAPLVRKLLTLKEASMSLGISEDEMAELVHTSRIAYAVFQDHILLLEEDIEEYDQYRQSLTSPNTSEETSLDLIRQPVPEETLAALQSKPEKSKIGYVYILRYQQHYKIGKAMNVKNRAKDIGVQMPELYELIHTIEAVNPLRAEKILQKYFVHKRLRGEWFALDEADLQWLKSLTRVTSELIREDELSGASPVG